MVLTFRHFGREVISNLLGITDDKTIELLYFKVYKNFIEGIDAIDNGVNQYDVPDQDARYTISTDLSARVGKLNPWWNQPQSINLSHNLLTLQMMKNFSRDFS